MGDIMKGEGVNHELTTTWVIDKRQIYCIFKCNLRHLCDTFVYFRPCFESNSLCFQFLVYFI